MAVEAVYDMVDESSGTVRTPDEEGEWTLTCDVRCRHDDYQTGVSSGQLVLRHEVDHGLRKRRERLSLWVIVVCALLSVATVVSAVVVLRFRRRSVLGSVPAQLMGRGASGNRSAPLGTKR